MTKHVLILNGGRRDSTLAALKAAGAKAKDKRSKRIIHRLAAGLRANPSPPAARSRAPHSKEKPVAKKHARRATSRRKTTHRKTARKTRRNPTAAPKVVTFRSTGTKRRKGLKRRVSGALAGLQKKTGVNIKQVALMGAGIAAGALFNSFAERQAEKYLPDLNPYARLGVVTLATGVAGFFVGKYASKDVGTGMMAGAIGEAIRSIGRTLAPGVFAGTEDEGSGYDWNPMPLPDYSGGVYAQPEINRWDLRTPKVSDFSQGFPPFLSSQLSGVVVDPLAPVAVPQLF